MWLEKAIGINRTARSETKAKGFYWTMEDRALRQTIRVRRLT